MITFAVEPWSAAWPELAPLWEAHWKEVALDHEVIQLEPDMASYAAHEAAGALHVLVARQFGAVVGYHISIVRPHLHYRRSLSAFTDVYFVAPSHRKGLTGVKLFREVERTLKARGVQKMFTGTKLHLDMSKIFQRLGYRETERLFTKVI